MTSSHPPEIKLTVTLFIRALYTSSFPPHYFSLLQLFVTLIVQETEMGDDELFNMRMKLPKPQFAVLAAFHLSVPPASTPILLCLVSLSLTLGSTHHLHHHIHHHIHILPFNDEESSLCLCFPLCQFHFKLSHRRSLSPSIID